MKIVIVPDSFKGSLSSIEVAEVITSAAKEIFPDSEVVKIPVADGGEGTVDALVYALNGRIRALTVTGPLGQPVIAHYGDLGETAVIEMASASGLPLLTELSKNPMVTSTYGTGEIIKAVLDEGFKKIIIGIGGSATNDGGTGAMQALGAKFLGEAGEITEMMCGEKISDIRNIDLSDFDARLKEAEITVMCDVTNPLTGLNGATHVYGPQKGADGIMVSILEAGMKNYETQLCRLFGNDRVDVSGAGAAGGLGAALHCFCNGKLVSGIDVILEATDFEHQLADANLVITGEGRLDSQSGQGKVVFGVATRASQKGIPTIVLAGSIGEGAELSYNFGVSAFFATPNIAMSLKDALDNAAALLNESAINVFRMVKTFLK